MARYLNEDGTQRQTVRVVLHIDIDIPPNTPEDRLIEYLDQEHGASWPATMELVDWGYARG